MARPELNIALYQTSYDNLQTSQFDGRLGFNVTNAGESSISGLELDGRWRLGDYWLLAGSLAWLDFEYDSFPNAQCYFDSPAQSGPGALCDLSGQTREFAPELVFNLSASYDRPIGGNTIMRLAADAHYSDDYFIAQTLDPNLRQKAYVRVNARAGLAWQVFGGEMETALLIKNLTDESIATFGNSVPLASTLTGGNANAYYAFYEQPQSVALSLRYRY